MKQLGLLSDELECVLFSNIRAILSVHKRLLGDLESQLANKEYDALCLGYLFMYYTPFLKLYKVYVQSQRNFVLVFNEIMRNKRICAFLNQVQHDERCRGLDLSGFLIMPVQRIPRYRLLLNEIIKHTPPTHPDYPFLEKSIDSISKVASMCDESLDWEEDSQILCALQKCVPHVEIIRPNRFIIRKVHFVFIVFSVSIEPKTRNSLFSTTLLSLRTITRRCQK